MEPYTRRFAQNGETMLNLTSRDVTLIATDGREPTIVRREGPRAADCIHQGVILTGETARLECGPMETARLVRATPPQVENLNRLLEEHIRKDEARTGCSGLVLIERELLEHVHPRLRERVAAAESDGGSGARKEEPRPTLLVFPPKPYEAPGTPAAHKGYTLFLDRAGLCAATPTTAEIGHAHTWEQLQWLARGAGSFERGGRLWAADDERNTVLEMSDIRQDGPPST